MFMIVLSSTPLDANLHQKMKKLVEFLDNNRNAGKQDTYPEGGLFLKPDFHLAVYSARNDLFQPSDWHAEKRRRSKVETHSTFNGNLACGQKRIFARGTSHLMESRLYVAE